MSLINNTDFLIHSMRLAYLRDVEDPYGSRILSLDPSYDSNPYIIAASMADSERWPEISMPASPKLSEDEEEKPSGFPGAHLKYTQTIMGKRTGGFGMRVHGKRASTSKRMSSDLSQPPPAEEVKTLVPEKTPVQESLTETAPATASIPKSPPGAAKPPTSESPQPNVTIQAPTAVEEAPVTKVVQFIPKFEGAAEERRRMRIAARRGQIANPPRPSMLNPEVSDEEPSQIMAESSSGDDFDGDVSADADSLDGGDDFDPVFPPQHADVHSSSLSEGLSVISTDTNSVANFSAPFPAFNLDARPRTRLSPVSEGDVSAGSGHRPQIADSLAGISFEMVTPAPSTKQDKKMDSSGSRMRSQSTPASTGPPIKSELSFTRQKIQPIKPTKSFLSEMLASSDSSANPFAEIYASVSGRGESASTNVSIYFPHAKQPVGKPMELNVKKDAMVEEVIGFALWNYWKEGWLPNLDEGLSGEDDPKWETRISAVGWIMRLAEEDGEIDDDFPPPDRLGKIVKFNADAYAILEATPAQIQQNQIIEAKIQRPVKAKKAEKLGITTNFATPSASAVGSMLVGGSVPLSTSLGPSSNHGPQIFLRIRTPDAVHVSTTIPVSAGMYMQEALEMVCRRRKLDPKDYVLLLADKSILIPLDRTVASLQGNRELLLVKRSTLNEIGGDILRGAGKTTDPNASIFKRMSDTPEVPYSSLNDYSSGYKRYTIYRKAPMLLARQERTLAIDGAYIHIMPATTRAMRAVWDAGKTSSYHIKSIADCQQSSKLSSTFKLVLNRSGTKKRYDFEAESPKHAAEIVQMIKNLKASLDRSGTMTKSRRSRHVG